VFGGDCFISEHIVKVSDTQLDKTGFSYSEPVDEGLDRVFAYEDFQEIMMVYLESEVNCGMQASPFIYPVVKKNSIQQFSGVYDYPYHPGYSIENELKIWTNKSETESSEVEFPSRIVFSDQRVFQTNVIGYDRFRSFSFYDVSEDYDGITKLIKLANNDIYCVQESGVAVIPVNKNVLETSDGGQLVVNSSTLINTPSYILNKNGSQHIRSVIESESRIFFMDVRNRELFLIGGGVDKISDKGMYSEFYRLLDSKYGLQDDEIVSGYDFNNNEYWIGSKGSEVWNYVWSDKLNAWTSRMEFDSSTELDDIVYSGGKLFIIGGTGDGRLTLEEMYANPIFGELLGSVVDSRVKFSINPNEPFGKTFDVLRIDSGNRLSSATAKIYKEDGVSTQETSLNLNVKPRHDSYELPMLLDTNKARLRGKFCEVELVVDNGDERLISINNMLTRYRVSAGRFVR